MSLLNITCDTILHKIFGFLKGEAVTVASRVGGGVERFLTTAFGAPPTGPMHPTISYKEVHHCYSIDTFNYR